VVSAADLAAWRIAAGAERTVATVAGIATGLAGTLVALGFSFSADPALAYAGVLVAAAAVALGWAAHLERFIAVAAGSAAAVALATPLPLPDRWSAAGYAVAALAVLAGAHLLAVRLRTSGALGASVVLGGAALWVAPGAAIAALSPARQLADVWSGVPAMLPAEDADRILPATPLVLALLAVVLVAADRTAHLLRALPGRLAPHTASPADAAQQAARSADVPPQAVPQQGVQQQGAPSAHATSPWAAASQAAAPRVFTPWAAVARGAAPVPAALAALTLPAVLAMPYEGALALLVAVAGALGAWAALDRTARVTAGGTAVVAALPAAVAALATRPATLAALGALTLLSIVHAVLAPALRAGATAVAVVALGGFAAALGLVAGLPVRWAAFGVLAGAALGAVAAARVRSVPAEVASWVVAAVAVAMTAGHPAQFSLALALTGVLALGVSLRADRRSAAWAGSALMLVAFWTRLGAVGVTVPEAYTAPVSVGALLVGALRRRRDRTLSSWVAYGSGLAVTLVPSLLAVWAETGRLRALLLALAAVVVTVAGARARLQAPLLLGGAVLLLDAAHELAPAVAEVTARLPGWCPIAVIGLAVLLLGATYEQRLRDLRRLREAVTRLG
jgi:hypothetical protein